MKRDIHECEMILVRTNNLFCFAQITVTLIFQLRIATRFQIQIERRSL